MKVKNLKPADYNPRKMSARKLDNLKKSMEAFGDLSGIVVNIRTGNVVGGHQRIKNFDPTWPIKKKKIKDNLGTVAEGFIETPDGRWHYREVDWDESKEKAANLSANKHSGSWDLELLGNVFEDLKVPDLDFDLMVTGFSESEFKQLGNYLNDGGDGSPKLDGLKYQIIIECKNEKEQIKLLKKFEKEKLSCRPLIL